MPKTEVIICEEKKKSNLRDNVAETFEEKILELLNKQDKRFGFNHVRNINSTNALVGKYLEQHDNLMNKVGIQLDEENAPLLIIDLWNSFVASGYKQQQCSRPFVDENKNYVKILSDLLQYDRGSLCVMRELPTANCLNLYRLFNDDTKDILLRTGMYQKFKLMSDGIFDMLKLFF